MKQLINLDQACQTFNVDTGELHTFTIRQWLSEALYRKLALVMLGDAGLGKTPAAKSLLSVCARAEMAEDPFVLIASTVDVLRRASDCTGPGVPVLLDDWSPGKPRGNRRPSTLEDIKHVLSVEVPLTVDARNDDLVFYERQARICTANARYISEWHEELPTMWASDTAMERRKYHPDIKAIFKRVCFCLAQQPLVDRSRAKRHGEDTAETSRVKVQRVLEEEA